MVNTILFFFLIPIGFMIYSVFIYYYKSLTIEKMTLIKRLYYSIWIFLILLTIYSIHPSNIEGTNPLHLPNKYWTMIIILISGILIAIIFDFLIISATGIKEISFGFAKVTKEEIKQNFKTQQNNIDYLTQLIEAEHLVIQNLDELIQTNKIDYKIKHQLNHFSYEEELMSIIDYFYSKLVSIKRVSYLNLDDEKEYVSILKKEYHFPLSIVNTVKKNLKSNKSCLITHEINHLFVPYRLFTNESILLIIQSKDFIMEMEQRFILNLLSIYENLLINKLYQIFK